MRYYYYVDDTGMALRVTARRKPSRLTAPKRGTWVTYFRQNTGFGAQWVMNTFPEITWGVLQHLEYIGSKACE